MKVIKKKQCVGPQAKTSDNWVYHKDSTKGKGEWLEKMPICKAD
jgi:hypothetical protein